MNNKITNICRTTSIRVLTGAFMMLCASAYFSPVQAEEANTSPKPAPAEKGTAPVQSDTTKSEQPATKVAKTPEEFSPSEEISEDFAVSFPVDI